MHETRRLAIVVLALSVAGCGAVTPPAGLTYRETSPVYAQGVEIVPNAPTSSGGVILQYSVSPALPAGLALDARSGAVAGTPSSVAHNTMYTVTGGNTAGTASARLEIEVKAAVLPPENLSYLDSSIVYVAGEPITPNTPFSLGGEIAHFSVSPALPDGLALDQQTGIITGTPRAATASSVYTVTGTNGADGTQAQLTIEVRAQAVPPADLAFLDEAPAYIVGEPIVYNEARYSGGEITRFSVSPALPAGLTIDARTGAISGTPTTAQASTLYTITGSNRAGSVTAQITILVAPATAGEWLPADSMNSVRIRHTATLLRDGRVLVAAGARTVSLSSAELYDPAANTWSPTRSLSQIRQRHTATLLPDGKVLVAGGIGNGGSDELTSAELYDPATGTWSSTGSLIGAHDTHTATPLPDGRVLVAGGQTDAGALASEELYDPVTGTWSPTGALTQGRFFHTATALPEGRVLVAGGTTGTDQLSSAELYDPATGAWVHTGSMSQARALHAATVLRDGKVLVTGGFDGTSALSSVELYDPATGTWSQTGKLVQARFFHTVTLLPNGKVVVGGGETSAGRLFSTDLYDPATGTWSQVGSMGVGRSKHTATLLSDGRVLVAGAVSLTELFH